jgi:hypothetical protein
MKKFLVLYQSRKTGEERMAGASPDEMRASMAAWMQWKEDTGDTLVDFGSPLQIGKHVESNSVGKGTANFSGYSIVQAESLDDAASMIQTHPQLQAPGMSIEVLEFLDMPGM